MDEHARDLGDVVWRRQMVHDTDGGEGLWDCCGRADSEDKIETGYTKPIEGRSVYWTGASVEVPGTDED